jgi:hypothetical protein
VTAAASLGSVGLDWQVVGIAANNSIPAAMGASDGSNSQLVQAMAGFGGGGGANLTTAARSPDPSQQQFLATPQHG